MEIDFFNFEWYVHVFNYFTPERKFYKIDDISYGKENVPVSCVNSLDNNYPEYVEYSTVRLPQQNVDIPLDEGKFNFEYKLLGQYKFFKIGFNLLKFSVKLQIVLI